VTWKADGTRYLMLLTREGVYLIDRAGEVRGNWAKCNSQLQQGAGMQQLIRPSLSSNHCMAAAILLLHIAL
jgi:hypothetical protein